MGGTLWRKIDAPGANITAQHMVKQRVVLECVIICWITATDALRAEMIAYLTFQGKKRGLTNRDLTTMIKKGMYNLMQNEVEKMKIGVGAMSELLRMFYDSLIQQNFTPEQAIQLTSDYMRAVFGK